MLTFFTAPKAFTGHIGVIQRNALESWAALQPRAQMLLFGDEEGIAATAAELGLTHVPEIARNEYGTPLLDDLLAKAELHAEHDILCYANADVLLASDFTDAVRRIGELCPRYLVVGQCLDLDVADSSWREALQASGTLRGWDFLDYFVFPRGLFGPIPPFAVGRAGFDNWLVWRARKLGAPVIDTTTRATAVHQRHAYDHVPEGAAWSYAGVEARRNIELAGGRRHLFNLLDATHAFTTSGLERRRSSTFRLRYRWMRAKWLLRSAIGRATGSKSS